MRPRFRFVIAAMILFSMCPFLSWGQEEKPQLLLGDFNTTGTVSVGYRFTTVKGEVGEYNDLFDLHKGFRLMDVNLMGRASEGAHLFADSYSVTASGLGGDPYSAAQLTLRKDKMYDLTVNYRQSYYYWGRNDNAILPLSPSGITAGLTSNHDWSTVRRLGSMNLNVRATNHLRFTFGYDRESRDGMTETTRALDYPGSPGYFGTYSRANPYLMAAPLNELTDRVTAGIDYKLRDWTFHYRVGYQTFTQNMSWNNLISPEESIDTTPPSVNTVDAQEKLTSASWSEFRRLTSPISEFSYDGKVNSWLELRGGYTYYRYSGPDTVNAAYAGNIETVTSPATFAPYTLSLNSRAQLTEPSHMVEQGLTAKITDWWNFDADYRYTRSTTDGLENYASIYNGAATPLVTVPCVPPYQQGTCNNWIIGTHLVDLDMEFLPTSSLVIRAGIRYMKRDVETTDNGAINPIGTDRTKSVWPTISVFYKPVKIFSVRGDFQSNTSTDPYTPISAGTDVGSRFVFRLQPTEKISIEDNLVVRDRTFLETSYHNQYRSNAIYVSYNFSNRFSANAGYSYESLFGTGAVHFIRPSPGFDATWQDAFINRELTGGLIIKPVKRFGINVSGNFLRTTGASQITGEPPTIGPLTFPLITTTLYYDFPKAGRLSIDLQRTYYIEQFVTGNNFQANLLTIKWTKNINPPEQ